MGGELFTLFAKLTLDTSEFDKKTDESKEKTGMFGDMLKANLAGQAISAAIDGLKKLGVAVKDFTAEAVNAYGDVEQLRGGIETLFGDSAQKVLKDADQAFKTAGMSASTYMETSIQSAASLINSLGGNQERAAEMMNMSITDMADNVNKMGTTMEAVQNAYRGFSRGNFTMLDNLALGFAGTKEGMQELIDKANEIRQNKDLDLRDLTIDSYADIVQAIHEVQDEMGITGTTAKEAAGTIQGSVGAMKAAWENLVAGIADPDADLGQLIDNMVETGKTALSNIAPAVERTFNGMGSAITKIAPVILNEVPALISNIAPAMGDAGLSLVTSLGDAIMGAAPQIYEAAMGMIENLSSGLTEGVPKFIENALPLIENFSAVLREGASNLVDVGIDLILNLAQGIMDSLPTLIQQLPQIVINVAGVINDNAPKLLVAGVKLIVMLIKGIASAVPTLIQNFPQIFQAILAVWSALNWLDLGKNVITWIKNGVNALKTQIPNAIKDIGKRAIEFFKGINWSTAGSQAIHFIASAIRGLASLIPNALKAIGNAAVSAFKSINWLDLGANIIRGIVNGISSNVGAIVDAAKNAAKRAFDAAKDFLGIKSPSRLFRDAVGAMIPRGLAIGIEQQTPEAVKSSEDLAKQLYSPFEELSAPTMEIPTATVRPAPTGGSDDILRAILEFLQMNWNNGEPVPIIIGGQTVGYYDRQLGMRATLARRGVV